MRDHESAQQSAAREEPGVQECKSAQQVVAREDGKRQQNGGMAEWRNGGMVEWRNGRMAEWRNGGMAEWRNGRVAEWHNVQYKIVRNQDTESTQMPPWHSPSWLVRI